MDVHVPSPPAGRPAFAAPRRVVTAPMMLQSSRRPEPKGSSEALVETLYNHPNVRIVAFTSTGSTIVRDASAANEAGTLSPSSRLERTIAVGSFRIYRAPGSVAFLSCGSALQPILPKSQCWCVDEIDSKFVLQIRRPSYWRIELPVAESDDRQRASDFRSVLNGVLQFEKTVCPFTRSFTVELPEPPKTPVKKKPWAPVKPLQQAIPPTNAEESLETDLAASMAVSEETRPHLHPDATASLDSQITDSPLDSVARLDTDNAAVTPSSSTGAKGDSLQSFVGARDDIDPSASGIVVATEAARIDKLSTADISPSAVALQAAEAPPVQILGHDDSLGEVLADERPDIESTFSESSAHDESTVKGPKKQPAPRGASLWDSAIHTSTIDDWTVESSTETAAAESPKDHSLPKQHSAVNELTNENPPETSSGSHLSGDSTIPAHDQLASCATHEGAGSLKGLMKARLRRTAGFKYAPIRSVTSPPELTLVTSPPSKSAQRPAADSVQPAESAGHISPTGSQDSFHSVQSWHSAITPLPPSPPMSQPDSPATFPYPHDNIAMPQRETLDRKASDMTITQRLGHTWEMESNSEGEGSQFSVATAPDTPPARTEGAASSEVSEDGEAAMSTALSNPRLELRRWAVAGSLPARRRAPSPMPPAANVFSPASASKGTTSYRGRLESVRKLPLAIIAKTYEMLLGPPSYLIALMIRVAAKISAGEWSGHVDGYDDNGDRIPVQWDYSEGDFSDWSDDEDPRLSGHRGGQETSRRQDKDDQNPATEDTTEGDSWDVD